MSTIKQDFGTGGAGIQPGHGTPDLATTLREISDDLEGVGNDWQTGLAVAAHVLVMPSPGVVVAAEGTTGSSTGVKVQQNSSSPVAGFVQVAYDAAGVPTLTFNATDAITVAAVMQMAGPNLKTLKG